MTIVRQATEGTFDATVLESDLPVLVDFYADFCPPCRAMGPVLETLATEIDGRAKVFKVDVVAQPALAAHFGVELIPTLIVFRQGRPISRTVGMASKDELLASMELTGAAQ